MPKSPSLKRNFIMNTILTVSTFLFPMITFPYISRVLLPEGNGQVAFATAMVSYFSMAASLGIPTYGIRACAQIRDDRKELTRTVHEIFIINAIMTILVYIVFLIAIHTIKRFQTDQPLFLVCGSMIFFNLIGMEWLYKALEQYQYITIRSILFKLVSVILMFLLVHSREDYVIYGGISVMAGAGANILNFLHIRHYISLKPCPPYRITHHIKPILVFFALTVAATIYTNLDIAMLGFISGDTEVGYYNAAVKVKIILTTFVTSLGAVLMPRISYYAENQQHNQYMALIKKAFGFVIFSAIPLCTYFMLMAKESILFLSGSAYLNSVIPMQVIMPTIFFIGLTNIIGIQFLVPIGKEILVFYSTCAGAVIDVILNLYFIPRYASTGAAIGTLTAELVVLLVQLWFVHPYIPTILPSLQIHKILAALIPSILVLLYTRHIMSVHGSTMFLTMLMTALCFFMVYLISLFSLRYRPPFR